MAYSGHKKEDIEDTSMESYWEPARPAKSWNPWGQLPPPQRGGGGEEESCASNIVRIAVPVVLKPKANRKNHKICV